MLRIAFDIGGVLSKYPQQFLKLITVLYGRDAELFVITDMHDVQAVIKLLRDNGFVRTLIPDHNIFSANYVKYGEAAKAVLLKQLRIDIFIDDFPGYVQWDSQLGEAPIRLLVQPDMFKPYLSPEWVVDEEVDFGRRVAPNGLL